MVLLSFAIALLHSLRACFRSQGEQALGPHILQGMDEEGGGSI